MAGLAVSVGKLMHHRYSEDFSPFESGGFGV